MIALLSLAWSAETFDGYTFYFGDPHAHTGVSGDGAASDLDDCADCGAFADIITTARANGLDWVAFSDHINSTSASPEDQYAMLTTAVLAGHDPDNGFVTVPAAEVVLTIPGGTLGHRTLLMFGTNDQFTSLSMADTQPSGTTDTLINDCMDLLPWLDSLVGRYGSAILIPHHPAATLPMPTDWSCVTPYDFGVEVYSEHGNSLSADVTFDPPSLGIDAAGTVHAALNDQELLIGFLGGTDEHDTQPGSVCDLDAALEHPYGGGLTGVFLDEGDSFDRDTLYEALAARRSFASTGPRVPMRVRWQVDGEDDVDMGGIVSLTEGQAVSVTVSLPESAAVEAVEVVQPAGTITLSGGAGSWSGALDTVPAWAYVAVRLSGEPSCEDGGSTSEEWLWSSPAWFYVSAAPDTTPDSEAPEDVPTTEPEKNEPDSRCGPPTPMSGWLALMALVGVRRARSA